MLIKNKDEIAITESRKKVLEIIEVGIERVLPSTIMLASVKYNSAKKILTIADDKYDVSKGRIFIIGGGKASGLMAETLEKIIPPEDITAGFINCVSTDYKTTKIKILKASHPVPDEKCVSGVKQMLKLKKNYSINKNDLVICLISGGGSALLAYPVKEASLNDIQKTTEILLSSGVEIHEINVIRKHLSQIKGGQLARFYSPATIVSLILSDIIGNDLDTIASGPTVPDKSTFLDAYNNLKKYNLLSKTPKNVVKYLEKGCAGKIKETPKKLDNCKNYIIGDNRLALEAMAEKAKELGFKPFIVTAEQIGEPTAMARLRVNEILSRKYADYNLILIGSETTPKLPENPGKGGRNQHYAAVSMIEMEKYKGEWVVASVGTDGSDFIPDVAGAIVDKNSLESVKSKGLDVKSYIDRFDSYTLFKMIGNSLIITGPTGTNVCDIIVYLI